MTGDRSLYTDPLVSVCVITYNSSKYVLEALDSVYNQSYQNLELIVSDDGSKDDTVGITERWLQNKRERFVAVKVLSSEKNTGTAANCNRALRVCRGELLQFMAGDDVLFHDALEKYVLFVKDKPDVKWVFAKAIKYNEVISDDYIMKEDGDYNSIKSILNKDSIAQFRRIVLHNFLWYPSQCFRRSLLESIGGFDESFGIYEDYPRSLRLYRIGEKCFFLDEYTMGYRYTAQSVVNNSGFIVNIKIRKLALIAKKKYAFDKLTWVERFGSYLLYGLDMFFALPFMNKRTKNRMRLRGGSLVLVRRMCYRLQRWVKL